MRIQLTDQAVQPWDACKPGDECQHCAAGRPEAPESAGDPADTASNTWEIETNEQRYALPPTYHRPHWIDTLRPPGWFCAACWDEGQITGWPCLVATRHGGYVSRAMREERDAQRPKPTCTCCGTSWPHVPSSERCTPVPAAETTNEQVAEFRHIVSEHHGYVPTDFAADCLSAVLGAADQASGDTRPYSSEGGADRG